jgi:hypothetical protein
MVIFTYVLEFIGLLFDFLVYTLVHAWNVVASVTHYNIPALRDYVISCGPIKRSCSSENEPHIWCSGFGITAVSLIAFLDKCLLCRIIISIRATKPLMLRTKFVLEVVYVEDSSGCKFLTTVLPTCIE